MSKLKKEIAALDREHVELSAAFKEVFNFAIARGASPGPLVHGWTGGPPLPDGRPVVDVAGPASLLDAFVGQLLRGAVIRRNPIAEPTPETARSFISDTELEALARPLWRLSLGSGGKGGAK